MAAAAAPPAGANPAGAAPASATQSARAVPAAVRRAAEEFESVFIAQILSQMNIAFGPAGSSGGTDGDPFASMLRDEYAKVIGRSGGVGLADAVMRELLRAQEVD